MKSVYNLTYSPTFDRKPGYEASVNSNIEDTCPVHVASGMSKTNA